MGDEVIAVAPADAAGLLQQGLPRMFSCCRDNTSLLFLAGQVLVTLDPRLLRLLCQGSSVAVSRKQAESMCCALAMCGWPACNALPQRLLPCVSASL